jgi:hypothetical protein
LGKKILKIGEIYYVVHVRERKIVAIGLEDGLVVLVGFVEIAVLGYEDGYFKDGE